MPKKYQTTPHILDIYIEEITSTLVLSDSLADAADVADGDAEVQVADADADPDADDVTLSSSTRSYTRQSVPFGSNMTLFHSAL